MALLYELEGIYAELQSMDLDDETFEDTLESLDFQSDLENNVNYFIKMYKNVLSDAESCKREKQEFYEKQKRYEAKAEKFKDYLKRVLAMSNRKKIDTGLFTISTRKSSRVEIDDVKTLPVDFVEKVVEYKPNKKEIKKALKNGKEIKGAKIVETENLQIK